MARAALPEPDAGSPGSAAREPRAQAATGPPSPLAGPLWAWGLSVGALLWALFPGAGGPQGSRLVLALLPFAALAGMPRRRREAPGRAIRAALPWPALALPPLALGLALERGAGGSAAAWQLLAGGLALVTLWSLAAESAAGARAAGVRRAYGLAWLVLVPGVAALVFALCFAALPGERPAPVWLAELARAHPLLWAWRAGQTLGPWPLVTAALVWGLARGAARGARPASSGPRGQGGRP